MTTPDITPPDVGDDAQHPKPDAVSFDIEHLRTLDTWPDPTADAVRIDAWVPIGRIAPGTSLPSHYMALYQFAEQRPEQIAPGRYRVIERRTGFASFHEYDVRLVQHVAIDRVKDDSDSQVPA